MPSTEVPDMRPRTSREDLGDGVMGKMRRIAS
jgi:hypothetical protein